MGSGENGASSRSAQELLVEFYATGREALFEEIVRRYAGMVFHTCLQVTKNTHDAEDATQATFLTMAVHCRTRRDIKCIGPWLQQVAYRLSLDMRKSKKRRVTREETHGVDHYNRDIPTGEQALDVKEMRHLVTEELNNLPPKYRLPLILYYFGGLSREEMAKELKCKPSTLGVRLFRGREMLGERLAGRGVALTGAVLAVALATAVQCQVRDSLVFSTCHAAAALAGGNEVAVGLISHNVLTMARGAAKALVYAKYKTVAAVMLMAGSALAAGAKVVATVRSDLKLETPRIIKERLRPVLPDSVPMLQGHSDARPSNTPATPPLPFDTTAAATELSPGPASTPPPLIQLRTPDSPAGTMQFAGAAPAPVVYAGGLATAQQNIAMVRLDVGLRAANPPQPLAVAVPASTGTPVLPAAHDGGRAESAAPSQQRPVATNGGGSSAGGIAVVAKDVEEMRLEPVAEVRVAADEPAPNYAIMSAGAAGAPTPMSAAATTNELWTYAGNTQSTFALPSGQTGDVRNATWRSSGRVLRGWGPVGAKALTNNGKVIADGSGQERTLDLSQVRKFTNDTENGPDGANGWYAQAGGRLALPVRGKGDVRTWGESPTDPVLDLVNSVRLSFEPEKAPTELRISLVSPGRSDVPPLTNGEVFLSVWSVDWPPLLEDVDLAIRYDEQQALALAGDDANLHLWRYNGQWELVGDSSFVLDAERNLIYGSADKVSYFAVTARPDLEVMAMNVTGFTTPEPGTMVGIGAAMLLLARRRRRE